MGMEESRFSATGTDLDLIIGATPLSESLEAENGAGVTAAAAAAAEGGRKSRAGSTDSVTSPRLAPQAASHLRFHIRNRPSHTLEMSLEDIGKGGYKHFMLKEVIEQPKVRVMFSTHNMLFILFQIASLCFDFLAVAAGPLRLHEGKSERRPKIASTWRNNEPHGSHPPSPSHNYLCLRNVLALSSDRRILAGRLHEASSRGRICFRISVQAPGDSQR